MHRTSSLRLPVGAALFAVAASPAWAHPGADGGAHHAMGFTAGFVHPFTGADHFSAMLAVGVWSALALRGRAESHGLSIWTAPLAFVAMLLVGALLGMAGWSLPGVEPMIAASVLVLGLLVAARQRLPWWAAGALVGGFAVFHGLAHGAELAAARSPAAALAGLALGTLTLHGLGLSAGLALARRHVGWSRLAGAGVAALGVALLTQVA